jgi:Putative phage abortive infection protein
MGQIQDNDEEREALPWWIIIVSLILLSCVGSFIAYGYVHPQTFKDNGTWGDFVGGLLNPLLTFLTVIGLLFTIHLQQRELRLTRKELEKSSNALEAQNLTTKRQRFENTLFSMIEMLNQIVNAMDVGNGEYRNSGRDCFIYFYGKLQQTYNNIYRTNIDKNLGVFASFTKIDDNLSHDIGRIVHSYDNFYNENQSDLGHYFRVLYNIFRYIDQSEFADGIYAKILRAQLSNQELLIIFYNNATERGKAFGALAERFELYDNMDTERLLRPEHIELASKKSFGKNPMILPV